MRVLVTGRHGQLVRSLQERVRVAAGVEITAVGRAELDLNLPGSGAAAVRAAAPDVVINAAAYTAVDLAEDEPELATRINGEAAGELAGAARAVGARFVQISTDYVFDGEGTVPYSEDASANPIGVYGRSKLLGEERVRHEISDHLILRTAWVYSPFGSNFLKTMMKLAATHRVVRVVEDQRGNPTSALDLADGLLAILERWKAGDSTGLGETYHLAGTGAASWADFAEFIFGECGALGLARAEVQRIGTRDWPTKASRPGNSMLESSKFRSHFGYAMPEWRQSAQDTIRRLVQEAAVA